MLIAMVVLPVAGFRDQPDDWLNGYRLRARGKLIAPALFNPRAATTGARKRSAKRKN